MTEKGLALVLIRMMALWLAIVGVQLVLHLAASYNIPVSEGYTKAQLYYPQIVRSLTNLSFGALLWLTASSLADVAAAGIERSSSEAPGPASIEHVGVRLIGLSVSIVGAASLVATLVGWNLSKVPGERLIEYLQGDWYSVIRDAALIVMGLLCWLSRRGIINGLRALRTAGQVKGPADNQ